MLTISFLRQNLRSQTYELLIFRERGHNFIWHRFYESQCSPVLCHRPFRNLAGSGVANTPLRNER